MAVSYPIRPLQWMLDNRPHQDTLAFQVDLWSADGELPRNLQEAEVRQKEIRYSSRTRAATNQFKYAQMLRRAFRKVSRVDRCPEGRIEVCFLFEKNGRTVSVKVEAPLSGNINEAAVAGRGSPKSGSWPAVFVAVAPSYEIGRVGADPQGLGHGRRRRQRHIPGPDAERNLPRAFVEHFAKDLKTNP